MSLRALRNRAGAWLARRHELVGMNRRNVELVYPHNPRKHYPIADDKLLAKEHFAKAGVPVADTLAICDGLFDVARVIGVLEKLDQFVVKPASGAGGDGIIVVGERLGAGRWRRAGGGEVDAGAIHKHLADIVFGAHSKQMEDRAFVERRIEPHPIFHALWADGLCDLRVITLEAVPVLAMVRVPTARSGGRANLHQGGLGLAIDLESGRTVRGFSQGKYIELHPETQSPLLGLEMPSWAEILEIARVTARSVPLGYLGVDLVVDRVRGPLVLEINARPGLEIQNVHGRGLAAAIARAQR